MAGTTLAGPPATGSPIPTAPVLRVAGRVAWASWPAGLRPGRLGQAMKVTFATTRPPSGYSKFSKSLKAVSVHLWLILREFLIACAIRLWSVHHNFGELSQTLTLALFRDCLLAWCHMRVEKSVFGRE
jgi:hypothetical protein